MSQKLRAFLVTIKHVVVTTDLAFGTPYNSRTKEELLEMITQQVEHYGQPVVFECEELTVQGDDKGTSDEPNI